MRTGLMGLACATTIAGMMSGGAALGQSMPIISPNLMNGFLGANAMQAAANQGRRNRGLPTYTGFNSGSRPMSHIGQPVTARASISTHYTRNPAVTRKVVDDFVGRIGRVAGAQKAELARANLTRHDFLQTWTAAAGSNGFRGGDAADSLAAYWTLNWSIANDRSVDAAQAAGARAQLAVVASRNPAFANLNESGRQALAETYMLNYILQQDAVDEARKRGDPTELQQLSNAAEQRFTAQMHMNLRALDLTRQGFVAKRG